jgi:hypothetical protein
VWRRRLEFTVGSENWYLMLDINWFCRERIGAHDGNEDNILRKRIVTIHGV